jgi:hypothetical protein
MDDIVRRECNCYANISRDLGLGLGVQTRIVSSVCRTRRESGRVKSRGKGSVALNRNIPRTPGPVACSGHEGSDGLKWLIVVFGGCV